MSVRWTPAERIGHLGTSIFTEMTQLAERTGSINLGQGVPELASSPQILRHATQAIEAGRNQYPPATGLPELKEAVAAHRLARTGVAYRPQDEVLVTTGATEAVAAALLAFCDPGDEVVTFDPCYDAYPAGARIAGARVSPAALTVTPDGFALDLEALRAAVGPRARVLLLNSPHNPTGKVFTPEELADIAAVCQAHDLTVVTDEVYEHLVYDGGRHVSIASLPGMRERTLVISSAGKSLNVTGWKIGWACGPARLVAAVASTKQFLTYASGTPFQAAVAAMLSSGTEWVEGLRDDLEHNRNVLAQGLRKAGLGVFPGEGGYFLQVDVRSWGYESGTAFCRELPHRAGVVAVPTSAFYQSSDAPDWLVRFGFCKGQDVLQEAVQRLTAAAR
ncbi:aminotransferase class I/II-fold pyridoxal phosphate-dependent enzyme [Streptomyces sp. NPDC058371]|uniref:aminotransferase class I/II-fold pyridoxal phosphate-dependent enzyme n=1 Tax=Streptomyces sp. NPDC058371 TaxID=3346463 RepID=UPI003668459B